MIAEIGDIDGIGNCEPDQEDRHQQHAECNDGGKRRRMQHIERVARRTVEPGFAAAAQLIEPDSGQRADEREAGRDRKGHRQQRTADRYRHQKNAEQRIDHAEEQRVARHGHEIVDAAGERLIEIGRRNAAHGGLRGTRARTDEDMCSGHGAPPEPNRVQLLGFCACGRGRRRPSISFGSESFFSICAPNITSCHHASRDARNNGAAAASHSGVVRRSGILLRVRATTKHLKTDIKRKGPRSGALSTRGMRLR